MKSFKLSPKWIALVLIAITIFTLVAVAGCGNKNNNQNQGTADKGASSTTNSKQVKLGFSFGQSIHPFFIAMEKGARDAAKKNNVELYVASADYKVENQIANVEDLLQKKIDALLINPVDSKALATAANEAMQKNVPVFTVDIAIVGAPTTSHIASDNKEIGRMAAKYIIDKLHGKGKVAIIGLQTVTSTLDREKGFMEVLEKEKGIQVVASQSAGHERAKALEAAENILQANPDVSAIFGVNESSAMGALSAVQARGLKNVFIVGVDSTPDMLNAIKQKTAVVATIAQNPYKMGEVAVELALKKLKGESVPQNVPVETDVVTIDNVDQYITREAQYQK